MKWYKGLFVSISISTLLFATACSGGGDNTADSDKEDGKDKVTIEYWHTYGDAEEKVLVEEIKPLFEEENPNIELKLTRMPYEGLKQQVIAGVSGGAAPDLMRMNIIWVPEFAKMGALQEVSALEGFEDVKNSVFEAPMATNFYDGKYYGLPVNTNTKIAIYNKALMDKAGVAEAPKTIDDLVAAAEKANAAGAKGAIGIGGSFSWAWLPYFWSLGGQYMYREKVTEGGQDVAKVMESIYVKGRDNARTPMHWDDSENAGFTSGKTWLKVNPNYKEINAKIALEDSNSIISFEDGYYVQKVIDSVMESAQQGKRIRVDVI